VPFESEVRKKKTPQVRANFGFDSTTGALTRMEDRRKRDEGMSSVHFRKALRLAPAVANFIKRKSHMLAGGFAQAAAMTPLS
jgi:hypothetical protein